MLSRVGHENSFKSSGSEFLIIQQSGFLVSSSGTWVVISGFP